MFRSIQTMIRKALRLAEASLGSGATLIKMETVMLGCLIIVIMALDTQETHWGIMLGLSGAVSALKPARLFPNKAIRSFFIITHRIQLIVVICMFK